MCKKIKLPNRYGYDVNLIKTTKDKYRLEFSGIYRIIGKLNNIQAVDPDGGPYISINSSINNQKVEKILIIHSTSFYYHNRIYICF